jgi:hypothetical protein
LNLDLQKSRAREKALKFCANHLGVPELPFVPKKAAVRNG